MYTKEAKLNETNVLGHPKQRWQCWCKFFPSSGKMCAKFYAVLLQKWVILRFCVFFWVILKGFYLVNFLILLSKEDFFLLLHKSCFYRCVAVLFCSYLLSNTFYAVLSQIYFCGKLCTFLGKIVFAQTLLGWKNSFFFHVWSLREASTWGLAKNLCSSLLSKFEIWQFWLLGWANIKWLSQYKQYIQHSQYCQYIQ